MLEEICIDLFDEIVLFLTLKEIFKLRLMSKNIKEWIDSNTILFTKHTLKIDQGEKLVKKYRGEFTTSIESSQHTTYPWYEKVYWSNAFDKIIITSFPVFIRKLDLEGSRVTDFNLKVIILLTDLTWLSVKNTPVTDRSISWLPKMKNLRYLNLSYTDVTYEGIKELTLKHDLIMCTCRCYNATTNIDNLCEGCIDKKAKICTPIIRNLHWEVDYVKVHEILPLNAQDFIENRIWF